MDLVDDLILTRITLSNLCDGFSVSQSSKNNILSIKLKILFLLEEKDLTPAEFISTLCIAKSNLANMLKNLIQEGLVESYRNENNYKNINYHITEQGIRELYNYKQYLHNQLLEKTETTPELLNSFKSLTQNLSKIIELLKRTQNND